MPKYALMSHQKEAVKFLDSVDGVGALLFEPGVGKTGSTLAWVDRKAAEYKEMRVLVVAPLTAADTWVLQAPPFMDSVVKARMLQGRTVDLLKQIRQARNWADVPDTKIKADHPGPIVTRKVTILSMSAGALSRFCQDRNKTLQVLRAVKAYDPHLIVVDESHIIKAATSTVSKVLYQMGQLAPHRIILTGTVNPLGPLDCYGQWRFLAPWTFSDQYGEKYTMHPHKMTAAQKKAVRPWPYGAFKDRYTIPGGFKGKGIAGYVNLEELNSRVAERSMVTTKAEALDLPPVVDVDVHVQLSPKEIKAYNQMRDDLAAELDNGTLLEAPNALAKMMKLRQITAGFAKDTETGDVHIIGDAKRKAVKEVCETTLAGENRIVVFAYFRSEVTMLAEMLSKAPGVTVEYVNGSTPSNERLAIRQRFADVSGNPGRRILVAQARTMSLSVNELVVAQHAVFASLSERRDDLVQARGRLDRNGQGGSKVTFWNVQVPGTIDEVMFRTHMERGSMEKSLLDHIKNSNRLG